MIDTYVYLCFQVIPLDIMVYTNWYPGAPSMTASKYLKYSVAYTKPFEPGQRYRNRRDMELTVSIAYFVVLIRSYHWSKPLRWPKM